MAGHARFEDFTVNVTEHGTVVLDCRVCDKEIAKEDGPTLSDLMEAATIHAEDH